MEGPNESGWTVRVTCCECGKVNTIEPSKDAEFWICSDCGFSNRIEGFVLEDKLDSQINRSRRELAGALTGLANTFRQMSRNEEKFDRIQHIRTAAVADIISGVSRNLQSEGGIPDIQRGLDGLKGLERRVRTCRVCHCTFLDEYPVACPRCGADLSGEEAPPADGAGGGADAAGPAGSADAGGQDAPGPGGGAGPERGGPADGGGSA